MNKRLQQFLNAENITQSQFAERIGVAKASVSHILAGRNRPGFDFIESMSLSFPDLNLDWLICGKGRMYKSMRQETGIFADPSHEAAILNSQPATLSELSEDSTQVGQTPHNITKVVIFYDDGTYTELI